ncbi:uncharacterized protein LY89DRAFT_332699 [Mollisia scopiformis]|uniref:Uncharacterized protein n=1 Tax=Mollisia scopiformis TaxID=149040 RepID=A0A132BA32_MOLSC|nr:uncharacterized protein LY89DRAFT_332699 [Mollisia scopiformis]KUJ08527.1 hypothetical protein LY89DRAFT_332699 [Mollisia scopiformis]
MPSIADIPPSPSTSKKRRRTEDLDSSIRTFSPHTIYSPQHPREILPYPNKKRLDTSIKRQRIDIPPLPPAQPAEDDCSAHLPLSPILTTQKTAEERKQQLDLSPCHICHRKPTERKQLDAFVDCEGCGERTCFVCLRECTGLGAALYATADGKGEGMGMGMVVERVGKGRPWERGGGEEALHRRRVCSRCCVEKGVDGEVWCLGCLRMEEGG